MNTSWLEWCGLTVLAFVCAVTLIFFDSLGRAFFRLWDKRKLRVYRITDIETGEETFAVSRYGPGDVTYHKFDVSNPEIISLVLKKEFELRHGGKTEV